MIKESPLFDGVEEQTVRGLEASLLEESWLKGHQIMGPSDSVESFRIVLEGRVKIVRSNSRDGRELTLWLLGPGDGFDIACLLDGRPHGITAWALDPVRTFVAPMSVWSGWLRSSRALRAATDRYIAGKLRELTELAGDLALHDTMTRLSHLLLRHFDAHRLNLLDDLPQRELAAKIGSVRIVVSRTLAQMRRRGIVEVEGGTIRALDINRLLSMAEVDLPHRRSDTARARTRRR